MASDFLFLAYYNLYVSTTQKILLHKYIKRKYIMRKLVSHSIWLGICTFKRKSSLQLVIRSFCSSHQIVTPCVLVILSITNNLKFVFVSTHHILYYSKSPHHTLYNNKSQHHTLYCNTKHYTTVNWPTTPNWTALNNTIQPTTSPHYTRIYHTEHHPTTQYSVDLWPKTR